MYVYEASGVTHNHIDSMTIIEEHVIIFYFEDYFLFLTKYSKYYT